VFYVVCIQKALVVTAGKPARAISCIERSFYRDWHRALFATDIQNLTSIIFDKADHRAIAAQPLHCGQWQIRLAADVIECSGIDMYYHLIGVAVCTAIRCIALLTLQGSPRHIDKGICSSGEQ
jgi:hypothetical protein